MSIPPRSMEMELNKPLAREIVRIFMEAVRIKRPFRLRTERRVIQRKTYLGLMRQFMVKIGKGTLRSIIEEQIVALNREYEMQMTIDLFADLLAEYEPQKTRTIAIQTDPTDDNYWMGTDDEESETEEQAATKSAEEQSQAETENNATATGERSKCTAASGSSFATPNSVTSSQGLVEKAATLGAEADMVALESVKGILTGATHIQGAAEKTTSTSAVSAEKHATSTTSTVLVVVSNVDGGKSTNEESIASGSKPGVWTEAEKQKAEKYKHEIIKNMGPLGLSYYDEEEAENLNETNEPSDGHSGDMAPPGVDNDEDMDASFSKSIVTVGGISPNANERISAPKVKSELKSAKSYLSEDEFARIQIERLLIYRDDPDMYDRVVAQEVRGKRFKQSNDGNCPRCHFKKNAFVILDFLFPMGDMPEICNYLITKGQAVLWSSLDDSHCKDPPTFLCRGKCPADPAKCGFNLNWNKTDLESVFLLPREDEEENKEDPKEIVELKTSAEETKEKVTSSVTTVAKIEESLEKVAEQSLESKEEEKISDEDGFDEREIDLNHYKKSVSWVVLDEFTAPNEEEGDEDHFIKTMLALSDAKEDWSKGEAKLWSDEESEGGEKNMVVEDGETQSTDNKKQLYAFSWDSYGGNPWAPVEFTKKNPQKLAMVASGKCHIPRLVSQDGSKSQIDNTTQPGNEITKDADIKMSDMTSKQPSDMSDATPWPDATRSTESDKTASTAGAAEPVKDTADVKNETSKDDKTEKPAKKTYTADDYPVSVDGTCPYCKSAEVVYIVISSEEETEDDNLPEILQKLLKINYAYKMPKDENEPPSFQCLKCTYGFNLDWSSTSLEDIFHVKLKDNEKPTEQGKDISTGYHYDDAKNKTATKVTTTSAQSYSYQMPTQAASSTYTAAAYPPPQVMGMNYFPPMGFPPMPFPPGYFPPPAGYFPTPGFPGYMPGMPGPGYMPYPMMGGPMPMGGGPPPGIPPGPSTGIPPRPLMGLGGSQWPSTGQNDTYKSGKYNQGSYGTSSALAKGTVTRGAITTIRGTITKGTVTKGTVTKGAVTREADKQGTITKGTVTKGTVTKGTVTKGPVSEEGAVKQTSSMGTNTEGSKRKRAATAMKESSTGSSKAKKDGEGLEKSTSEEHSASEATNDTHNQPKTTNDNDEPKDPTEHLNQTSDERNALTPVVSINEPMPPGVIVPTSPNIAASLEPTELDNSEKSNAMDTHSEDCQNITFVDDAIKNVPDITEELKEENGDEEQLGNKRLKLQATDSRDTSENLNEPIEPSVEASQVTETDLEPETVVPPPVKTVRGKGKGRARGRGRARGVRGRKKRGS